jgi:transketolase
MEVKGEDLFFLSNGHISPVFYSTLARFGFFPVAELATFRKLNSRLQGHPTTHEGLPGVRVFWFSGQGLSVALELLKVKNWTETIFGLHTSWRWRIAGRVNWEAFMYAAPKSR